LFRRKGEKFIRQLAEALAEQQKIPRKRVFCCDAGARSRDPDLSGEQSR